LQGRQARGFRGGSAAAAVWAAVARVVSLGLTAAASAANWAVVTRVESVDAVGSDAALAAVVAA